MGAHSSADEAIARVQRDIVRAQQRSAQGQQAQQAIAEVRGIGRSRNDEAVVTVDASGMLRDLRLADEAMELDAGELTELILRAARAAQRHAGAEALAAAERAWGADDPAVERLRAEIEQRYA